MFDRDDINLDFNSTYAGDNGVNYNDIDINMNDNNMTGNTCPVTNNVIHRTFYHDEEHIVPVNTHIVNHHIIRHFYKPCYSVSEENVVCNVNCNCMM